LSDVSFWSLSELGNYFKHFSFLPLREFGKLYRLFLENTFYILILVFQKFAHGRRNYNTKKNNFNMSIRLTQWQCAMTNMIKTWTCWCIHCADLLLARLLHRYLMNRLSLQVFYLWRPVSSTAPPLILWWSNLEILFGLLHRSSPFIGELRCQAIQTEHGPAYSRENLKSSLQYIVRCLWFAVQWKTSWLNSAVVVAARANGWAVNESEAEQLLNCWCLL
jgi:hypothetical protein